MTPEEQAGAWCVRLASGGLSPAEQAEFDDWMVEDPSHDELFDRALIAWRGISAIADSPEVIARRANALEALRRANRKRWSGKLVIGWQWGLGLAAAVVLAVFTFSSTSNVKPDLYATGVGERRIITLADGSRVSLDADTKVSVLYGKKQRALTLLNGRAKFEVAKNPDRPFTVTAGGRTTVATGTAFSVELLRRTLHVVLYEGRVNVIRAKPHSSDGTVGLVPGEELVTDVSPTAVPTVSPVDTTGSLAWENGQLNFVDEPLASAVEQLNRYSPVRIVVGDARASAIRINGVFNAGDSQAFLDAITQAYPIIN
ncbi:MAG: FecR domain-containing protein [Novosphingobium sp.]